MKVFPTSFMEPKSLDQEASLALITKRSPFCLHLVQESSLFSNAEPSPLHTSTIVENCTLKLVDDYKHMLCQATEPMTTFLEYISYPHGHEELAICEDIDQILKEEITIGRNLTVLEDRSLRL